MKFVKDALLQLPACCCLRNVSNFRKLKWNPWSNGSIHVLIIPGSSYPIPHKREVTNQINCPKFFNVKLKLVTDQIWPTCNIHHHVTITKKTAYLMLSHLWCYQELSVQLQLPHEGSLPDRQASLVGIWQTVSWLPWITLNILKRHLLKHIHPRTSKKSNTSK